MTGLRRLAVVLTATAVGGLGLNSAATAATTTPGSFTFDVTTAKVGIGPVPSIPINPATLGGQAISLSGTVDGSGNLAVPKDEAVFPTVTIPIPQEVLEALAGAVAGDGTGGGLDIGSLLGGLLGGGAAPGGSVARAGAPVPDAAAPVTQAAAPAFDVSQILDLVKDVSVTAGISPTGAADGTVDPATGATTMNLGLGIGVGINATASLGIIKLPIKDLVKCGISPLDFKLTTGSVAVPGKDATLTGAPYDPGTGLVTLVGAVDSPAPACKLNALLGSFLGDGDPLAGLSTASLGAATVELTGRLNVVPAGPAVPPAVTVTTSTPQPAPVPHPAVVVKRKIAAALLKLAKTIKVTGKTVAVKIACRYVNCKGSVKLATPAVAKSASKKRKAVKARTLGTHSYKAKAGKTTTVKVTLSRAARALLKKQRKATVKVTASVSGGKAVTRTVTLTVPAPKKRK